MEGKTKEPRMRLTHLGHACLLVETAAARLLIDPGTMSAFDDVVDLDAVLVTHQHGDHVDPARLPALLAANPGATLFVDADTATAVPGPEHAIAPRVAVPIHEGETTHPDKYAGMLAAFSPAGVVRTLPRARGTAV
jgi:glyoxylase-like metal-dependent hydrolase (beta-lactamase superfamily II)